MPVTDAPTLRQRILARLDKVSQTLEEIGHLPGNRLLAIDVSMTPEEHIEWLRRLMNDPKCREPGVDGEAALDELRARLAAQAEHEKRQGTLHGTGTPDDIAERIGAMPEGKYRFSLEPMPSSAEFRKRFEELLSKSEDATQAEFAGKTEDEIQEIANTLVEEARAEMRAERLQLLRRIGYARRGGFLSDDEFLLLAYELVLARFGADHRGDSPCSLLNNAFT